MNEKKTEEERMDHSYNNEFFQENIEKGEYEEEKRNEDDSDIVLVVGLNYFKHEAQNSTKISKKIYFFPCDISLRLFDWQNVKEITKQSFYHSFQEYYKKESVNFSLDDIEGNKIREIEESIVSEIKKLITEYNINHVYVYGYNKIIRRLFQSLDDSVYVYNIKDMSPSLYPDPIDLKGEHRTHNYKRNQACDRYFSEINDVVMKISRIFTLGYDEVANVLRWENVNGKEMLQAFIGRERIVVDIKKYVQADRLSKMNILSLALLRRILEKEMNHYHLDVEKKAKDLSCLIKMIYLSLVKPNYFAWVQWSQKNIFDFTIACPQRTVTVKYNSQSDIEWISEELINFINMHSRIDEPNKDAIDYGNNNYYNNILKFAEFV